MKARITFPIFLLALAACLPALAGDRDAFDEAFPRPDWRFDRRQDAQVYTGIGETLAGATGGVATAVSGNVSSLESLVKEEGGKAIRSDFNKNHPELALQLLNRDTSGLKVNDLNSRKSNLLSELRNGRYVDDSGYRTQFVDGKAQQVYVIAHHYEELSAVEKEQARRFIADIDAELPAAKSKMAAMKAAAAPAEKVFGERMATLLKNRAAGTLTEAEAEVVSLAKRRLGLGLAGAALSLTAVADGLTRFLAAADNRDPGFFPAFRYSRALSSRAIKKIADPNGQDNDPAPYSGYRDYSRGAY